MHYNQIINTKKMILEYRYNSDLEYQYFNKTVLPVLESVIPSTTIFVVKEIDMRNDGLMATTSDNENAFANGDLNTCIINPDERIIITPRFDSVRLTDIGDIDGLDFFISDYDDQYIYNVKLVSNEDYAAYTSVMTIRKLFEDLSAYNGKISIMAEDANNGRTTKVDIMVDYTSADYAEKVIDDFAQSVQEDMSNIETPAIGDQFVVNTSAIKDIFDDSSHSIVVKSHSSNGGFITSINENGDVVLEFAKNGACVANITMTFDDYETYGNQEGFPEFSFELFANVI